MEENKPIISITDIEEIINNGDFDSEDEIIRYVIDRVSESKNIGLSHERINFNDREKAFHDNWLKENLVNYHIDHGKGILQNLMVKRDENKNLKTIHQINDRDREIVATVIQWLGSNVGFSFLERSLADCGYRIVRKTTPN